MNQSTYENYSTLLSSIGFILLFPGFFVYHTLAAEGLIPLFLGGFFSPVSVLVALLSIPTILPLAKRAPKNSIYPNLIFFFAGSIAIFTAFYYVFSTSIYITDALYQSALFILQSVAVFFVGANLNTKNNAFKNTVFILTTGISLYVIYNIVATGSATFYHIYLASADEERVATYQGLARSASALFIFCLCFTGATKKGALLFSICSFVLFSLGARSEFFGFIFSFIMLYALSTIKNPKNIILFTIITLLLLTTISTSFSYFEGSRQMQVLDLDTSTSWQARNYLLIQNLHAIYQHPFLGSLSAQFEIGGYAHNILSTWVSYGLINLILYLALCSIPFIKSITPITKKNLKDITPGEYLLFFCLSFSILLIFISKSMFWQIPPLVWGIYFGQLCARKNKTSPTVRHHTPR